MELSSRPTPVVLVADDEPTMLALVSRHVRALGYDVLEASEGETAWHHAAKNLPDLVILDVMMPGMSGWEVCRRVREHVALAHTGVIMLTGIGESLNELTSPLYGADAYIDKPFEFKELDEKIYAVLKARGHAAITIEPPPPSGVDLGDDDLAEQDEPLLDRSLRSGNLDAVVTMGDDDDDDGEDEDDEDSMALTLRAPPNGSSPTSKMNRSKQVVQIKRSGSSKPAPKASKATTSASAKVAKATKSTKAAKSVKAAKPAKAAKTAKTTKATKAAKGTKASRTTPKKVVAKSRAGTTKQGEKNGSSKAKKTTATKASAKKGAPAKKAPSKGASRTGAKAATSPKRPAKKSNTSASPKTSAKSKVSAKKNTRKK